MFADCRLLTRNDSWAGHFDGVVKAGTLRGWAFNKLAPASNVDLHLYICGIHIATTSACKPRPDVDKKFGLSPEAKSGFEFSLDNLIPEGALALLRFFNGKVPPIDLSKDVRVAIADGRVFLPSNAASALDLSEHLPALYKAASIQLRTDLASNLDISSISMLDQEILLQSSPLFSADWYLRSFPEVADTGLTPAQHYLFFGNDLERPCSPWFDTTAYLEAAPAARESALPALLHYELVGHDTWWPGQGRFRRSIEPDQAKSDYAVIIHLYHLETIPDLQWMLRNFSPDVDVFITVPEESPDHDPDTITSLFPQARQVIPVPNRGQDVGAFLHAVRMLKSRRYRLFCKAYSGRDGAYPEIRRRVSLDALAATPHRVEQIVSLLQKDPRILMAGPSEFWVDGSSVLTGDDEVVIEVLEQLHLGKNALRRDWTFFSEACFWIDAALAELVAEVFGNVDNAGVRDAHDTGINSRACIFGVIAAAVYGKVALIDGRDWAQAPRLAAPEDRILPDRTMALGTWSARYSRSLAAPRIIPGTTLSNGYSAPQDIFIDVDESLHGSIDVIVTCWNGNPEDLHLGLANLGHALEADGLTCAYLLSSELAVQVLQSASSRNVFLDSLYLRFGSEAQNIAVPIRDKTVSRDIALSWLRSEALFRRRPIPEGGDLETAIENVQVLYGHWRAALVRRRVKLFLIWGTTAPKSRMFIHLCQELGIEYQIIERGHFPGTLSVDPIGQFGGSVMPRLVQHVTKSDATDIDERFAAIRAWYQEQADNAAYAKFQRRDTRDIALMRRARNSGRPVILVIGGNDQGAGVVGPDPDPLRVNWFGTSDQAFSIIRKLVSQKFPDALLVLRPHPSQAPQEADFVLVARDSALDDLVDQADLCISVATTASAICLLKDKPLLTLGLSELNGSDVGIAIKDETHLLSAIRHSVWSDFKAPYPKAQNRRFIVDLFDKHLVGVDASVPTRHHVAHLAQLIAGRIQRMKTGFLQDYAGREGEISRAMFEDVRDRGRAIFPVDPRAFVGRTRPAISVVLPIYGDYEGTRLCFEQLMRHQADNGYRVITVWDRGPDERLRDLCLEYAEKAGFTYLENRENVGFSGTVNQGILEAGRDDVILLNSDTVQSGDWALRLQDAAYAHPKIAAAVPMTNNATIFSVPFPNGCSLPHDPLDWVAYIDQSCKGTSRKAVEMPVAHGFCTYVRRSVFDIIGLYDEVGFGIGQGEDNDFSMRMRSAGYFIVASDYVFVGHFGSTSFGDDVMAWKVAGRKVMNSRYPEYMSEISHFFTNEPLKHKRDEILSAMKRLTG